MKSTLLIAVTAAVLSSAVTYRLTSPPVGPMENYREHEGGKSSASLPKTPPHDGIFRPEDHRPSQQQTMSSSFVAPAPPFESQEMRIPPPPPHELPLQNSPEFV